MATPMVNMPARWSNKREVERLRKDAYESLTRMLSRAVAETGANFSIWSALRTKADQIALFKENYTPAGRGRKLSSDRGYAGRIWKKKPGGVNVASPDLGSNHQTGVAIDIHPAAIQNWIKSNGNRFGWDWSEGRRNNENWHFRYFPAQDTYKSEGFLDHAAVQKAVGAEVDGKIGTGTVAKIRAFQKSKGLEVDGKVGPATKKALGLSGKGSAAPVVAKPKPVTAAADYKLDKSPSPNAYSDRKGHSVKHVTLHHWGRPTGQKRGGIIAWLTNPKANVSAHYVVTKGHVTQLVEESCGSWANGNKTANLESITIECDPNDPKGTAPTVAALISDIRGRHGDIPIYPHQHWVATECPGAYLDLLPAIDAMSRGGSVNLGRPVVIRKTNVTVDSRWGKETTKALQRFLKSRGHNPGRIDGRMGPASWKALQRYLNEAGAGIVVDGLIENQSYKHTELGNGISPNGWQHTGRNSKGSKTIRNLQKWVGVKQDGIVYEGTTRALQRKLNVHAGGK